MLIMISDNTPERNFKTGMGILVMTVFVLLFSNFRHDGNAAVYNIDGERKDIAEINYNHTDKSGKDTIKNKGSLDGDQKIISPDLSGKPFDPNAPFTKLTFRMLRTYIPGKALPEDLKKLNGTNVEILGFMVPLVALENMDEFLLTSAPPLNCYCAPPVFINEIIYVKMMNSKTDFKTGAIKIRGQFSINLDIKDEYSDIIYSISAVNIE